MIRIALRGRYNKTPTGAGRGFVVEDSGLDQKRSQFRKVTLMMSMALPAIR